jgi:hypothetical protein
MTNTSNGFLFCALQLPHRHANLNYDRALASSSKHLVQAWALALIISSSRSITLILPDVTNK